MFVLLSFANKPNVNWIEWTDVKKLEWNDFRGPVDSNKIDRRSSTATQGSDSSVTISSYVETEALCFQEYQFSMKGSGDSITYELKNFFNTSKSWKRTNSIYVLNHEQRHFDLAEVYARKFRKLLKDSINTSNQTILNSVFKKFSTEESQAQLRYDEETSHSVNQKEQARYDREIDSMLVVYEAFKSPSVKKKWNHSK